MTFESEPQLAPEQPVPESVQFTPLFCVSFCSVAEKFCVPMPAWTDVVVGETLTEIFGAVETVMAAVPVRVLSVTEAAVSVTSAGEGTAAGAV